MEVFGILDLYVEVEINELISLDNLVAGDIHVDQESMVDKRQRV